MKKRRKLLILTVIVNLLICSIGWILPNAEVIQKNHLYTIEEGIESINEDYRLFYEESSKLVSTTWNENYFDTLKINLKEESVTLDGKVVESNINYSNIISNDNESINIPIKEVLEIIGAKVQVDDKKITIDNWGSPVELKIDNKDITINEEVYSLKSEPSVIDDKIMLPSEVFTDGLGYTVEYDKESKIVTIQSPYQTMRLIVKIKDTNIDLSKYNATNVLSGPDNIKVLQFDSIDKTKLCYEELKENSSVEYVEPDIYFKLEDCNLQEADNVSSNYYNYSWGVSSTEADKYINFLKDKNITRQVIVAVVDTGIDFNHSFFKDRILDSGYDFINSDSYPQDDHWHGTHVSGTVVDMTKGLNIKLLPVKVLDYDGRGTGLTVVNGITYASRLGADVINFSIGMDYHVQYIDDIINEAISQGVTFVQSAGNDNINTDYACPAHIEDSIVVSAIDEYYNKAVFSNYGNSIDIAAPGVEVLSAYLGGGYAYANGTSMAAPHISAIAAMYKLNNPLLKPADIEKLVEKYVQDLGSWGKDIYYGTGIPKLSLAIEDEDDWYNHWAVNEIRYAMKNGWVNEANKFRPNHNITRAEFIKIVNKAFGFKAAVAIEKFTDVNSNAWYYDEVRIALKAGYITDKNSEFRPDRPITREEVASIITTIKDNKDGKLDKLENYKDKDKVSKWARTSVEGAIEAGYMGKNSNMFNPQKYITRAEAVTTLYRVVR